MTSSTEPSINKRERCILIAGASRGIGYAMASEFLKRGWKVIGTARHGSAHALTELAVEHTGRLQVETLDIDDADSIAALRDCSATNWMMIARQSG